MVWQTLTDHLEVIWGAAAACGIVILLTPAVGGMARLLGVVDEPGARRLNRRAVPRLGGLALFFGIFVPALAFLPLGRETKGLLLGMAVATLVGAIDDFRGLAWWQKLGGQITAAGIAAGFGIWVHRFTFPVLGVHALPEWVGISLTIFWIVAIMNMVNFLDGLDGLAAGVCAISGVTFCLIALSLSRPEPAILAAIVFGACLGFLRHNFYPARIFMGDSGAMLLGFTLGALSVQGLLKTAAVATLLFPLLEHPKWRNRLYAAEALLGMNVADERLVSAMEKLAREPEAEEHDLDAEEFNSNLDQSRNQHAITGGIPSQPERGQQIIARACRSALLQIPHGAQPGRLRNRLDAGEVGKQRGRARAHVNAPIARHGCLCRLADQFEFIVVTAHELAESVLELLAAPVIGEQIVALRGRQIRGHDKGLIILHRRVDIRARWGAAQDACGPCHQ